MSLSVLLLWPALSGARVLNATPNPRLTALPDGQWSALADTAMEAPGSLAVPCCDYSIGCELSGIFSYSGATLNPDRHQIVLWGGGHNDYFGNQLLSFDIATLSWQQTTQPTSLCLFSSPADYRFTNGDPVARHTYDHIGYIDHLSLFFSFSGATSDAPPFNSGSSYGDLWTFDFDTGMWSDLTPMQSGAGFRLGEPGASGEYDPQTQRWFQISQYGIWSMDFDRYTWTKINEQGHPGIERVSVMDPLRRWIWTYGGAYAGETLTAYDIDANELRVISTNNLPGPADAAGLTYDVANDQLVLFGGLTSHNVFNYDIKTGQWTEFASVNGPPPADQVYGRFVYDAVNNLFFMINSVQTVWVWKNTLGGDAGLFADGFEAPVGAGQQNGKIYE